MPEYALILLLLFLVATFLHRRYKVKLFKSKSHLLIFYAILLLVGITWDHIAVSRGHWIYNKEFLLGPHVGLAPIEGFGFTIVGSYFGLVVYKIIEKRFK